MESNEKLQEDLVQPFLDRVFVQSHSKNTVNSYRTGVNQFAKFLDQKYQAGVYETISKLKEGKLDAYKILSEFVIHLDKLGYKPRSIRAWVAPTKEFLRYTGIKIYAEDCKQIVKMPKKDIIREEPLTREILTRLLHALPIKLRTAVLVATASGMRLGELVQLRISDIDFSSKPTRIMIRAETTKGRVGRETYLTTEATTALKDFLKRAFRYTEGKSVRLTKDTLIFGTTLRRPEAEQKENKCDPVLVGENVLLRTLHWHIKKIPELNALNENGRRMIHFHAFRKYFRTLVGDAVGRDYAEALMGHRFYLDTYYNLPVAKRREMYLKAEPHLTISDFDKIERDLNKIAERQQEIEIALDKLGVKLPRLLEKELQEVM